MYEIQLEHDSNLFNTLLDIPNVLGFEHPLYIDSSEFSVVLQYLSLLTSVVRTFREWEYNFDTHTRLESRYVNGKGLGFIAVALLEEEIKQVNYEEMFH